MDAYRRLRLKGNPIVLDKGEWWAACRVVSTAGVHAEDAYMSSLILVLMAFFVSCGDSRTSDANAVETEKPRSLSQVIQRLIPSFRPAPIHSLPQNLSSSSEVALGLERPLEVCDTCNTQSNSNERRIASPNQSLLNTGLEQSARQSQNSDHIYQQHECDLLLILTSDSL